MLPCLRSQIAKKLLENGFSQKQVADRLGLSQPAISQYKKNLRGHRTGIFVDYPQVLEETNSIATRVASGETTIEKAAAEMFSICKELMEGKD